MFIDGAMDPYNETANSIEGIMVVDNFTLEVQLTQPAPCGNAGRR